MAKNTDKKELAKGYFNKGVLLQKSGHLDRAAHCYKRSIEFEPTAQAHTFLGWILSLKGLYNEAIEECKKAIVIDPDFGNPYNDIGAYLLQQHRYDESKEWFNKALGAPNYENYCYPNLNLGRVYEFKGLWKKALFFYKRAIKENPYYEPAQHALKDLMAKYN
jgi:Tfp pilus assembly protein PilF